MQCFRLSWAYSWACACLQSSVKRIARGDIAVSVAVLVLYSLNRFLIKPIAPDNVLGYLLRCHVNDYLGGVLFPVYTNILISVFLDTGKRMVRLAQFVSVGVVCAVFWEGIAPLVLSYSTADILDCIAYIFGSLTCWHLYRTMAK